MSISPETLSEFIVAEVARQGSEENVRKLVEANIAKTIAEAVHSSMRSYGDIGKQIEKAVNASLQLPASLDVPAYGVMVMAVLRQKMDEILNPLINERLAAEMTEILGVGAREIKLGDIVEAMKGETDETNWGSSCTVIIEDAHPDCESLKGYRKIYLDPEDVEKKASSSLSRYVRSDAKRSAEAVIHLRPDGRIDGLTIEGKDAKITIGIGPLFGWQKTLFALYATGGTLTVEHDSGDDYDTRHGDY